MAGLDAALASVVTWIATNLLVDTVRIALPATGEPVFNPETGQLEYPQGTVLYEGPGAVLPASGDPSSVIPAANQPWTGETRSAYKLLTPLDAPVAPKDALVTVTAVHDPAKTALTGRTWVCSDAGRAGTVEAVRITVLDQQQKAAS